MHVVLVVDTQLLCLAKSFMQVCDDESGHLVIFRKEDGVLREAKATTFSKGPSSCSCGFNGIKFLSCLPFGNGSGAITYSLPA